VQLVANEALPARLAVAVLVVATGVGLTAIAWIRTGARPRSSC
jgi:hypothetical protein